MSDPVAVVLLQVVVVFGRDADDRDQWTDVRSRRGVQDQGVDQSVVQPLPGGDVLQQQDEPRPVLERAANLAEQQDQILAGNPDHTLNGVVKAAVESADQRKASGQTVGMDRTDVIVAFVRVEPSADLVRLGHELAPEPLASDAVVHVAAHAREREHVLKIELRTFRIPRARLAVHQFEDAARTTPALPHRQALDQEREVVLVAEVSIGPTFREERPFQHRPQGRLEDFGTPRDPRRLPAPI